MKSIWIFQAVVDAPIKEVLDLFSNLRAGEFDEMAAPFIVAGKGKVHITYDNVLYVVTFADGHREFASVDREANMVAVQGEWWYRGEYTFAPEGDKTRVQLEVFNLADQEWMVSLMNIGAKRKHEAAFVALCRMAERVAGSTR